MRKLLYLAMVLFVFGANINTVFAQDSRGEYQSIFGSGPTTVSGWGAFEMKTGQILSDELGLWLGGKGGLLINETFTVGLAGYGLIPYHRVEVEDRLNDPYLEFGYGGLYLEYAIMPRKAVHFNANCIIGAGAAGLLDNLYDDDWDDWDREYDRAYDVEPVFVVEPGVNVGVNFTKWFRVDIGASYRYVHNFDTHKRFENSDLSGVSGNIAFKFGGFTDSWFD